MPAASPMLLAFDSSTEQLAIALVRAETGAPCLHRWCGPGGPRTSAELLPRAGELLREAGATWADLAGVAFGAGPGAFTGLRAACAAAQGLGFGLGLPVLAVDSLMILAEDAAAGEVGEVADGADPAEGCETGCATWWVAVDARMDEVYAGAYRRQRDTWHPVMSPALYTLEALNKTWAAQPPCKLAGNAARVFGARLAVGQARRVDDERDRAAALARLAQCGHARGLGVEAAEAAPVYLRDKVALTEAERAQARRAAAGTVT